MSVVLKFNPEMKRLLDDGWVDAVGAETNRAVLKASLGSGGIENRHFNQRQGQWPRLAASTLSDKRKTEKKTFVFTGAVRRAITTAANDGKLLGWGSSADMYSGQELKKTYTANGIQAFARVSKKEIGLTIRFAGKLKTSKQFNSMRRKLAAEKGIDVRGKGASRRIQKAVSVTTTVNALRSAGVPYKKFEAKGILGISGGGTRGAKMVKARGKDNLAYADIVQAGPVKGFRSNKTGTFLTPAQAAFHRGKTGSDFQMERGKKPRPLLPYDNGDVSAIEKAMYDATRSVIRKIGGA